jgi:hypothetical protein
VLCHPLIHIFLEDFSQPVSVENRGMIKIKTMRTVVNSLFRVMDIVFKYFITPYLAIENPVLCLTPHNKQDMITTAFRTLIKGGFYDVFPQEEYRPEQTEGIAFFHLSGSFAFPPGIFLRKTGQCGNL